jgi:leucyl aminopeptidase
MPTKLEVTFADGEPHGDIIMICLVGKGGQIIPQLDQKLAAHLIDAMSTLHFTGDAGKSVLVYHDNKSFLLFGIGDNLSSGRTSEDIGGKLFAALTNTGAKRGWLVDSKLDENVLVDIYFGAVLAAYHFDKYFTENKISEAPVQLYIVSDVLDDASPAVVDRKALADGVFVSRDLVFEPANKLFPESFAERCSTFSNLGLEIEILDEMEMKRLGMGALLGVGQGSPRGSRMVVMNWSGGGLEAPLALVGKGVTFDTGGISLF